jgi:hypothetical protein
MAKMLRRQPSFLEWASFDAHPLFVATCDNVPAPKLELLLIIAKDECGQVGGLNCFLRYLQTKHWCKGRWFGLRSMGVVGVFRARGWVKSKRARDCESERRQRGLGGISVSVNMTGLIPANARKGQIWFGER